MRKKVRFLLAGLLVADVLLIGYVTRYITTTHEVGWSRGAKSGDLVECVSFDVAERSWKLVREPVFVAQAVCDGILDEGEVERWRSSFR